MRYGLIPGNLLERLVLASGRLPVPILDALYGPLKARAIMAAVSLGIFEAMRDGDHAPDELARQLGVDAGALELLLRTLVICDYLVARKGRFALTPMVRRTLVAGAPMQLVGYMRFNYRQWDFLGHLEALIRTGRGIDFHETMTDPQDWRNYQQGMLEVARFHAPILAARVPVRTGARSLLDLAGSHGLLGAAICRRRPAMRATVLDLPQALDHARALGKAEGLDDVVRYREGDVLTADYGRDHDVVLLSNILHHFVPAQAGVILERARAALRDGGTAAIWELEAPKKGAPVTSGDGAALYFRLTSTAGAYHGDEYAEWLRRAGFGRTRIVRPMRAPGYVLVSGRT